MPEDPKRVTLQGTVALVEILARPTRSGNSSRNPDIDFVKCVAAQDLGCQQEGFG